jgi:hypothetical protein
MVLGDRDLVDIPTRGGVAGVSAWRSNLVPSASSACSCVWMHRAWDSTSSIDQPQDDARNEATVRVMVMLDSQTDAAVTARL